MSDSREPETAVRGLAGIAPHVEDAAAMREFFEETIRPPVFGAGETSVFHDPGLDVRSWGTPLAVQRVDTVAGSDSADR